MSNKSHKNLSDQASTNSYPQKITKEGFEEFMGLQKQYIDKGDTANAENIGKLIQDVVAIKGTLGTVELGLPFYVAAYNPGVNDNTPQFSKGNPEILNKFDFFLLDTTDNDGEYTTPVGKLLKNNLLHFASGGFAPVVGITKEMYRECIENTLYIKEEGTENYIEAYAAGAFDAEAQWAIDKPFIANNQEPPTVLLKKVEGEYIPVTHVLRPWETTETKYTIGIAPAQDLYLLDNVRGASGKYWKGIFLVPMVWDGIDITKFKVARTAIGPCPMTTVIERGVTKCRNFFYLYESAEANCKSGPGLIPNNPFYNKNRHYPRTTDVNQVSNMNWARANNADATKSFPFAEGGWWATNAHIIALELLAGTRYLHRANMFGSGISSNDDTNTFNFYISGGSRFRVKGDTDWQYKSLQTLCNPYYYKPNKVDCSMGTLITDRYPIEASMESQMAASMATELGIAPTERTNRLNTFKFYGDTYYYMDVPNFAGLRDGSMNVRVYKVQSADVEGFNADGQATTFEMEFVLRMSLFNGANLSGDILVYNGGGLEMVCTTTSNHSLNLPVDVYLQPDQKQWHSDSVSIKDIGESWDFEKTYIKVGEYLTKDDGYALERMSNAPVRVVRASTMNQGECYYNHENSYLVEENKRDRRSLLSRGIYSASSPRYLGNSVSVLRIYRGIGGSFQALIEPQA